MFHIRAGATGTALRCLVVRADPMIRKSEYLGYVKPTDRVLVNPEVVLCEEFDDWAVLFHPLTGDAIATGSVGVLLWKVLDGQRTLVEIAADIAAQCEDAPDTVLEDTIAFSRDLYWRSFVVIAPKGNQG